MRKINLQLFASLNTQTSIVDYLKSQGQDSSKDARAQLASSLGISNYTGSAEQNSQMLKALQSGGGSGTTSVKTNTGSGNRGQIATSQAGGTSYGSSIIRKSTMDAINTPFTASNAYQEAMSYTNGLLQQLSSGRTSYSDQVDAMIKEIQNREDFQYDVETDTLFQQALSSAMRSGQTAMQDTMGQAAALTGGYGSTYATSAANQAYNAYIEDAYNNLPEYYQMALEAYQMEGQEMYQQLAMLSDADAREYERTFNAWSANNANAQQMYANEYSAWQDQVSTALSMAGLELQEQGQLFDQSYAMMSLEQDQRQFDTEMAYRYLSDMQGATQETDLDLMKIKQAAIEKYALDGEDGLVEYLELYSDRFSTEQEEQAFTDEVLTYVLSNGNPPITQGTAKMVDKNVIEINGHRYDKKGFLSLLEEQGVSEYELDYIEGRLKDLKVGESLSLADLYTDEQPKTSVLEGIAKGITGGNTNPGDVVAGLFDLSRGRKR